MFSTHSQSAVLISVRFLVLDFATGKIQNDVLLIYQGGNLQKAPIMKKRVNLTFPKRAISIPI
ncbi:MAG: hypothetical protein ACOYMQ_09990, partial [Pseudanabaena sp.]